MILNVIAAVDDLIFASKIKATAEIVGAEVRFAKSLATVLTQAKERLPDCVLVDLHGVKCEPFALARAFKTTASLKQVRLIGFFSHVQTSLLHEAQAAGYDQVLPRSAFTKKLPELLGSRE